MAADEVSIFNMALNAVGTRDDVSAVNEVSREAEVCRLWFEPTRDQVLRAAPWPAAKAHARLAVLATRNETAAWTPDAPDPGFLYAYATPSDMLAPRYSTSFSRFAYSQWQDKNVVMSNEEAMILCYTKKQTLVPLWDIALRIAIAHALAAYIAIPLVGKSSRAQLAQNTANGLILQAREQSANDDNDFLDTVPDWFVARGYGGSAPMSRFYWPLGPMINFAEASAVS